MTSGGTRDRVEFVQENTPLGAQHPARLHFRLARVRRSSCGACGGGSGTSGGPAARLVHVRTLGGFELDDERHRQLLVRLLRARLCVLSETATWPTSCQACTSRHRVGIAWDEPVVEVEWPIAEPQLSERDRTRRAWPRSPTRSLVAAERRRYRRASAAGRRAPSPHPRPVPRSPATPPGPDRPPRAGARRRSSTSAIASSAIVRPVHDRERRARAPCAPRAAQATEGAHTGPLGDAEPATNVAAATSGTATRRFTRETVARSNRGVGRVRRLVRSQTAARCPPRLPLRSVG